MTWLAADLTRRTGRPTAVVTNTTRPVLAMRSLLDDNHERRAAQHRQIRRAIALYRSLLAANVVERVEQPDDAGRMVRIG